MLEEDVFDLEIMCASPKEKNAYERLAGFIGYGCTPGQAFTYHVAIELRGAAEGIEADTDLSDFFPKEEERSEPLREFLRTLALNRDLYRTVDELTKRV